MVISFCSLNKKHPLKFRKKAKKWRGTMTSAKTRKGWCILWRHRSGPSLLIGCPKPCKSQAFGFRIWSQTFVLVLDKDKDKNKQIHDIIHETIIKLKTALYGCMSAAQSMGNIYAWLSYFDKANQNQCKLNKKVDRRNRSLQIEP